MNQGFDESSSIAGVGMRGALIGKVSKFGRA